MKLSSEFIYGSSGYKHLSLHRKVIEYDPRNTDNLIILDYFEEYKNTRYSPYAYHHLIDGELLNKKSYPDLPLSFTMVLHEMNFSWIAIIHQMIFVDQMYETFFAEYVDVLNNIIEHDSPDVKHSIVYRNIPNGESIFHMAAKLWLLDRHNDSKIDINININDEMKYILNSYQKLEQCFGDDRAYCIVYMMDFSGKTMADSLSEYLESLRSCV